MKKSCCKKSTARKSVNQTVIDAMREIKRAIGYKSIMSGDMRDMIRKHLRSHLVCSKSIDNYICAMCRRKTIPNWINDRPSYRRVYGLLVQSRHNKKKLVISPNKASSLFSK